VTLAPSTDFGIRGIEGERYDVNEICAVPGCGKPSRQTHHMWSRSYLRGQPYDWIVTSDGTVIGNRVGLCIEHHDDVSSPVGGHRAKIRFGAGIFWWDERDDQLTSNEPGAWVSWKVCGPLVWQPPGALPTTREAEAQTEEADVCPVCGKPRHSKPHKPLAARKTKDWTLVVPDDAEIGSDVLDGWADDLAEILGFADASSRLRRYHAVATGLAWVIQHRHEFVGDLVEASK
jgi:hypothetical protein